MTARDRVIIVVVSVVATLAVVAVAALALWSTAVRPADGGALAIPTAADHYPAASRPFTVPGRCGLTGYTIDRLVPDAEGSEQDAGCSFMTTTFAPEDVAGVLRIRFDAGEVAEAMRTFDVATRQVDGRPATDDWKLVTGLGEEALVRYSTGAGDYGRADLHFRAGAVTVTVIYRAKIIGQYEHEGAPLAEGPAIAGALDAAAEVAASIGAEPERPAVVEPSTEQAPPSATVPHPCQAVPEAALRAAGVDPDAPVEVPMASSVMGTTLLGCAWTSGSDVDEYTSVRISVDSYPASRHRGGSESMASREFAKFYYEKRKTSRTFYALSGPGEKALARYWAEPYKGELGTLGSGEVMFVVRDFLINVRCAGASDRKPLSEASALNKAYALAKAVAATVPK